MVAIWDGIVPVMPVEERALGVLQEEKASVNRCKFLGL
jgi:hypothetical protein